MGRQEPAELRTNAIEVTCTCSGRKRRVGSPKWERSVGTMGIAPSYTWSRRSVNPPAGLGSVNN